MHISLVKAQIHLHINMTSKIFFFLLSRIQKKKKKLKLKINNTYINKARLYYLENRWELIITLNS